MTLMRTTSGAPIAYPLKVAKVKARERRNGAAIHGYTGTNGGGKTMRAVADSLPALAAGRPIVSTCRILDPITGDPHPLWIPLDDFRVLLEVKDCEVILDEVTGIASARDAMALPSAVLNHLMQLRKDDVTLRWVGALLGDREGTDLGSRTTPNWKRADTGIREVTQALTTCVGLAPVEAVETTAYGTQRRWRQTRLFVFRTYDARKFDEWSTAKERSVSSAHRIKPFAREVMWGPGSIVRDCYDTYDHALAVGAASEAGTCLHCQRSKPRQTCKCKPGEIIIAPDTPGIVRWRLTDATRRNLGASFTAEDMPPHPAPGRRVRIEFAETDDTPGVVVETPLAS